MASISQVSTGSAGSGAEVLTVPVWRRSWNPYLVGTGLGVLSWVVFAAVDKPLGVSTSLSAAAGACAIPFVGADAVAKNPYWAKHVPKLDYGMLFVVGT